MKHLQTCLLISCFVLLRSGFSQTASVSLIRSGPMPGYADMREAMIWLQTRGEAVVYAVYTDVQDASAVHQTAKVKTKAPEAFTARLVADSVEPGRTYRYSLFVNGQNADFPYPLQFTTPPIWRWRGDPPDFTLMTGSCAYVNQAEYDRPGTPYGGDYRIFTSMAQQKADLMLWLGDNIYLREPDWNSWTGIVNRYTHTRSLPEMQPFLASTHHYAIWDDHDYGPDNSNRCFVNKNQTLEAFRLFWGNPTYGSGDLGGIVTSFQWGDADFFLLDNRWFRDPDEISRDPKTMLGQKQLEWLFDNLITSKATFKIVAMGGQFLSDIIRAETYSANGFGPERQKIIDFIQENGIRNVIFITGDVHFSEMSVLKKEGKPSIYDLTFSTMSAGPNTSGDKWNNSFRVPGTAVTSRNFGMVRFSGPANARVLTVSCYSTDNVKLWEKQISQE
jgi:alkaline phosphatase D